MIIHEKKSWRSARIYPEPVLIIAAYDENGTPQCMNAAWGGLCASDKIMMSVNPAHATVAALRSAGAFSVSMGQADQVVACDYVGITSATMLQINLRALVFMRRNLS